MVDSAKREQTVHGTPREPVWSMDFQIGPGLPYSRPFYIEPHWHPSAELLWVLDGDFEVEVNLETFTVKPDEFFLIGPEELHQIRCRQNHSHHIALLFDPQIFSFSYEDRMQEEITGPLLHHGKNIKHLLTPSDDGFETIAPCLRRAFEAALAGEEGWYLQCKLLLLDFLCKMNRFHYLSGSGSAPSSADLLKVERFKSIASYIDEHLTQPITLDELAALSNCSSAYFCRFFREISGLPPIRYVIGRRIEFACRLLETTEKPILAVSLESGFDNVSYFIRTFRKQKGMTPGEYRDFTRASLPENRE